MVENIVNEFRLTANAFTSVKTFIYDRLSVINTKRSDNDDTYPLILLEATPFQTRGNGDLSINKKFLPRKKVYEFNLFLFDLYKEAEKKTKALEVKQGEVEILLEQYIAQIIKRVNQNTTFEFQVIDFEQMQGIIAHDVHSDKLVQVNYKIKLMHDTVCDEGTFNY